MHQLFEILFIVGKPSKISKENCHISETECRRKLKFGEVSLQICQSVLRKKQTEIF